ncbi:uncharacterized protein LOC120290698 [Eucalyptus grandis]|uniref:uncharacterized protein LOC120290698 n=1 Tax=Eucalyptus grandis TaxID=71139 RepID=UPI00192E971D|nr:uncharacterized protein LOC120290698 [Eucalyptus grandis]
MASSTTMAFLARLVVLLPVTASAADSLAPFIEELCGEVQCGNVYTSAPFGFECRCKLGWKQMHPDNEDDLEFHLGVDKVAGIVTISSVVYTCMPAPPPVPSVPYNTSVFDRKTSSLRNL